jgi:hypothetical protein
MLFIKVFQPTGKLPVTYRQVSPRRSCACQLNLSHCLHLKRPLPLFYFWRGKNLSIYSKPMAITLTISHADSNTFNIPFKFVAWPTLFPAWTYNKPNVNEWKHSPSSQHLAQADSRRQFQLQFAGPTDDCIRRRPWIVRRVRLPTNRRRYWPAFIIDKRRR